MHGGDTLRSQPVFSEEETKIVNPPRTAQNRLNEVNFWLIASPRSKLLSFSHIKEGCQLSTANYPEIFTRFDKSMECYEKK